MNTYKKLHNKLLVIYWPELWLDLAYYGVRLPGFNFYWKLHIWKCNTGSNRYTLGLFITQGLLLDASAKCKGGISPKIPLKLSWKLHSKWAIYSCLLTFLCSWNPHIYMDLLGSPTWKLHCFSWKFHIRFLKTSYLLLINPYFFLRTPY